MKSTKPLPISSERLLSIAETFGTPTYAYDEALLRTRCKQLQNLFTKVPVRWLYAIKANDNPHLLSVIREEGFGFDTVSYEEVLLAEHVETDPHEIFYTENNMSDHEMESAIDHGVVLNIGSYYRLEQFCNHPKARECCIRLNPQIGDGHHSRVVTGNKESKFGIGLDKIDALLELTRAHDVKVIGIHTHIGSGISEPENLIAAMKRMLELSQQFSDLEFINFGGGLPVPYRAEEQPFNIEKFGEIATDLLRQDYKEREEDFTYWFEPGRWVVAECGLLLTEITCMKDQGEITYLGTNSGFNHLARPVIYDSYHQVVNLNRMTETAVTHYTVSGNICESGDILAKDRELPESREGEILAFSDAGAYGMTMASHYNRRSFPAEVLVTDDGVPRVIRPRKTHEETVEDYLNDTGF